MLETIITVAIILSALAASSWLSRRAPERGRIVLARTAVLSIGVSIAFCVAQAASAAGMLDITLAYTPLDVLSSTGSVSLRRKAPMPSSTPASETRCSP